MSVKLESLIKKREISKMLNDEFCFIHLDATDDRVDVPRHLKDQKNLTLKISHYFVGRLTLGDEQIEAELTFNDSLYRCVVPYDSIWGATSRDGKTILWDSPATGPKGEDSKGDAEPSSKYSSKKPHLKRIK